MPGSTSARPRGGTTAGTGRGGQHAEATVRINPTDTRVAGDFPDKIGERRGPLSPWYGQLADLVALVNTRSAAGDRLIDIGEFVCIGQFASKYGARNRMRKCQDAALRHQPVVDGYGFEFKADYVTGDVGEHPIKSELWAALVPVTK